MNEIERKMEDIFIAVQNVQDLVIELGALVAQVKKEESTVTGASS